MDGFTPIDALLTAPTPTKTNTISGFASGLRYDQPVGDLFRLFSGTSEFITGFDLEGLSEEDAAVGEMFRKLRARQVGSLVAGNTVTEVPGEFIGGLAQEAGVPPGPYTNVLYEAARHLDDYGDLRIMADFLSRKAAAAAERGPVATFSSAMLDPTVVIPLVGVGAKAAQVTRAAGAATRAGTATRLQSAIASRPFVAGAAAEGTADLGLQTLSSALDVTGERQVDLMGVALAGAIGGGITKIVAGSRPKLTGNFKPTAQQTDLAKTGDELQRTTTSLERMQTVEVEKNILKNAPDGTAAKVAGSDNQILTKVREIFSPLVRVYNSKVPAIRDTARLLGGVQTEQGGRVFDFGDNELESTRKFNMFLYDLDVYRTPVNRELRIAGIQDDLEASYVMARYVRRRVAGQEPDNIDMAKIIRNDSVDPRFHKKVRDELERLYGSHGKQMKGVADELVAAEVKGAKFIDAAEEGKYLTRAYNAMFFPRLYQTVGRDNIGDLFTKAIMAGQLDDITQVMAERVLKGRKKLKGFDPEKSDIKTADELLAEYPTQLRDMASKFSKTLGRGMSKSIYDRMTGGFFSQIDAITINEMTDDFVESILDGSTKIDGADLEDFAEVLGDFVNRTKKVPKGSSMGQLNSRIKMNELVSIKLSAMKLTPEQQADVGKILGRARQGADDELSFEDLLYNDYHQLQMGYFHQASSQLTMARRGLNREGGATVEDVINVAKKQVDDLKGKASEKEYKRAQRDLDSFIYLMHTANGKGVDFAKGRMQANDLLTRASVNEHDAFVKGMGIFRNLSTSVHLGMVAFAQGSEAAQMISSVGIKLNEIDRYTGVVRDIGKLRRGDMKSDLARDMVHVGFMHQGTMSRFDGTSVGSIQMRMEGDDLLTRGYNKMSEHREFTAFFNLIKPATLIMRAVAFGRSQDRLYAAAKAAGSGKKGGGFSLAEMQTYFGINEDELPDLYKAILANASVDKKTGAVRLNTRAWHAMGPQYAAAAAKLDQALFNFTHTIVQESGRGYAPIFMQGGLGGTLFQFMSYASNSFEKQFVPTLLLAQRGDAGAAGLRVSAAMLGSLIGYTSRLYVKSLGMSEERRAEYLQENLTFPKTVLGTISYLPQLSGPMIAGGVATQYLIGALGGDSNAVRKGLPSIPAYSTLQDVLAIGSIPARLVNPEQEVTEASLNKLMNYASGGILNTPAGIVPRNVVSSALTGEMPSLNPNPPRKEAPDE